ncbi:hypothetical protein J5TS2_22530 [Brevibacillus halotolerans]|nr:hypothetical protein J5TS2_22530 [Brevibacillus halotolerans]
MYVGGLSIICNYFVSFSTIKSSCPSNEIGSLNTEEFLSIVNTRSFLTAGSDFQILLNLYGGARLSMWAYLIYMPEGVLVRK